MVKERVHNWILVIFNWAYILGFTAYYLAKQNYEFMIYISVLVVLFIIVFVAQKKVKFTYTILWMLSIWGLLHMMGGGVHVGDGVLYKWVPIEMYNAHDAAGEFVILKYDQILHFYIFFVMSFALAHALVKNIGKVKPFYFYSVIALASMGLSVVNELIEFGAVVVLGNTGVGGYYNTLLDLVFNTAGAVVGAWLYSFLARRQ